MSPTERKIRTKIDEILTPEDEPGIMCIYGPPDLKEFERMRKQLQEEERKRKKTNKIQAL